MSRTAQHLLDINRSQLPRVEVVETARGTFAVALVLDGYYTERSYARHTAEWHAGKLAEAVRADTGQPIDYAPTPDGADE